MFYSRYIGRLGRGRWTRAVAVALTAYLLNFVPAQAAGGHWTASSVIGVAVVTDSGRMQQTLSPGQPVVAGCTVATGDDSAVVLTRRGDSITVYPNSVITIPATSGADELGVVQSIGKALFRMETRESRDFEVRTPFLAATVKGTIFTVAVSQTQATVTVAEGMVRVEAARGGRSEMVRPGWAATVEVDREFVGLAARQKSKTDNTVEMDDPPPGESPAGKSKPDSSPPGKSKSDTSKPGKSKPDTSKPGNSPPDNSSPHDGKGQGKQHGQSGSLEYGAAGAPAATTGPPVIRQETRTRTSI